jgi:AmmeMemoRadiSam system protein A
VSAAEVDQPAPPLDESDRRELLRIARVTLKEYLKHGRIPPGAPHRPSLLVHAPAFVTLRMAGRLRGCIGYTDPATPLYRTVAELAIAAATGDPRFPPLTLDELAAITISISVLSARAPIAPGDVVVGTHGLLVTRYGRRGLLLPQVPVEQGWEREEFLDQTCIKAELPRDAWREPDTTLEAFTADVFSE